MAVPLIESGHRYIRSLQLTPEDQAILRAHCREHRRYVNIRQTIEVRSSVFSDVAAVCEVLKMPGRPEGESAC